MKNRIIIFDTTLRDGEQSLKSSLTVKEKIKIALSLEKMGVDIIEAGFPVSSPGDFKSIEAISSIIKDSTICSLARCLEKDIDVAALAMSKSKNFRIHLFLGTSELHIQSKLRKNFEEIVDMAVKSVIRAKRYTDDIEFSCEDAGRTSIKNLCKIIESVIKAGANTINIPDTVGYTLPNEFGQIIHTIKNQVSNIELATISVHCHNDLGMATGNSICAIQNGARQIEGTINGIGERAGNTALEEVIMAIETRSDLLHMYTNINYKEIYNTSKIVSIVCDIPIPINKSIVGENAFSHSSGVHQDGILKNRRNYEIINPESIGIQSTMLNLTSRSGRAAVKHIMKNMGYQEPDDYHIDNLYPKFLKLADKVGQVFDYDLEALVFFNNYEEKSIKYFQLKYFNINLGLEEDAYVIITLLCGKEMKTSKLIIKNDPFDAIYRTLKKIVKLPIIVQDFNLSVKGLGDKSLIKTNIIIRYNNRDFYGVGFSNNVFESSLKAMIHVLNNIFISKKIYLNKEKNKKFYTI